MFAFRFDSAHFSSTPLNQRANHRWCLSSTPPAPCTMTWCKCAKVLRRSTRQYDCNARSSFTTTSSCRSTIQARIASRCLLIHHFVVFLLFQPFTLPLKTQTNGKSATKTTFFCFSSPSVNHLSFVGLLLSACIFTRPSICVLTGARPRFFVNESRADGSCIGQKLTRSLLVVL